MIKKKKCKICKIDFTPFSSTSIVCSFECALVLNESKKKEVLKVERKNWLEKKKIMKDNLETVPELIKKFQKIFNLYIRVRDLNMDCISCNKQLNDIRYFHAGHYYSAGHHANVRFNPLNVHGQCIECNMHLHGNLIKYRPKLEAKIGSTNIAVLDDIAYTTKKWDKSELNKLIDIYKLKLKIMKSENKY